MMQVEIPDIDVLNLVLAFLIGVGILYGYAWIRPRIRPGGTEAAGQHSERLEYYERQLIDMKIRMDALENHDSGHKEADPSMELRQFLGRLAGNGDGSRGPEPANVPQDEAPRLKTHVMPPASTTEHMLRLITDGPMTSRDIQITLGKTREHTSRLLKKLCDDGYAKRDAGSRPYTYTITEKGRSELPPASPETQTA